MIKYGLTKEGFIKKRYADIIKEKEAKAKELFGDDVNLSESSPLGLFIQLNAWEESTIWEMAENVYFSSFLNSATGVSLDRVAQYIGIRRLQAQKATGTITITGSVGTYIPAGSTITTASGGVRFRTDEDLTLTAAEGQVGITAGEVGLFGNVAAGTLVRMINPIIGVTDITNNTATDGGRNVETDGELRSRYTHSIAFGGASTVDSIRAALINTIGVKDAIVKVNTNTVTTAGRPPKSFEAFVVGGDAEDIAQVILNTGAAGIQPFGTETVTVLDSSGQEHVIGFSRAEEVDIYVTVQLFTDTFFPADGLDLVRTHILDYIGGTDEDGTLYRGIEMGDAVVYAQLIQAALKVPGVLDAVVKCGKTSQPTGTVNIPMQDIQIAISEYDKIEVTKI